MILIDLKDKFNWDNKIKDKNYFVGHTWEYSKLMSTMNKSLNPKLLIFDEFKFENICAISQNNYKNLEYIFNLPGYTGYNNYFNNIELEMIRKIIKKNNFITYYFSTNKFYDHKKNLDLKINYKKKNNFYLIDLRNSLDEIYRNFNSNLKRKIKRCIKENIILNKRYNYDEIMNLILQNNKRLNLKDENTLNEESGNFLIKSYEKKIILSAYKNKKLCSAVVIFYNSNYAEYFSSFSINEHNYITGYLLYEIIKILRFMNIKYLNLGGAIKKFEGIEMFKKSFGGNNFTQFETKLISDLKTYKKNTKNMNNNYFPKFANV